jgi:hypothetical protein
MKKLIVTGLFCLTLISSACSSSIKGGYVGTARLSGLVDVDGLKEDWSEEGQKVFALVTVEGKTRTVDFSDTDLIRNCELHEGGFGQTCGVNIKGIPEVLKVNSLSVISASAVGPGGIMIEVQGISSKSKTFVTVHFSGLPYAKK